MRVQPSQELKIAVWPPSDLVAGPIEPCACSRIERVRDEPFCGQLRLVEIAARHTVAAGIQLTQHAHWHRLERRVQNINPRVGNRAPNRDARSQCPLVRNRIAAGERRVLGRAVTVDDPATGKRAAGFKHMLRREHIAARQQLPQRFQIIRAFIHHEMEQAGRQPQCSDPMLANGLPDFSERWLAGRQQDDAPAVEQRAPQFKRGRIKRERRDVQQRLVLIQRNVIGPFDQPCHASVRHQDALGLARRAGGVVQVCRVNGATGRRRRNCCWQRRL